VLALPGSGGPVPLLHPAIVPDNGRVLVPGTDGFLRFVTRDGTQERAAVAIGSAVTGPPAVGAGAIWLARQDGQLSKRSLVNGDVIPLTDCASTGGAALLGPPTVFADRVIAASSGQEILVARASGSCAPSVLGTSITTPAVIDTSGAVVVATGSVLRRFTVSTSSALVDAWTGLAVSAGGTVSKPLALDAENGVWSTAASGLVYRTTSAGVSGQISSAPSIGSQGSIILADGSVVVADEAGRVRRIARSGQEIPWTESVGLVGSPRAPLALRGTATATLLVPTSSGRLYAISEDTGQIVWETNLSPQGLQPANVWTQEGAATSTAYLSGDNGSLYAVIVDGTLDTTAPWPKVFHDPQNTSNAATPFR